MKGRAVREVDQMAVRNGWIDLGRYPFTPGGGALLTLSDATDEAQFSVTLSVSAARFTLIEEESAAQRGWLPILAR